MASSQATAAIESPETYSLSVQELIKDPKLRVPECYVRPDQELPNLLNGNAHFTAIPTIDMERLVSKQDSDFELEKLHATLKDWGIFQLVNHGVSSSLLEKLNYEIQEFFKLPFEEKMKYKIKPGDFEGYGTIARPGGKLDWGDRLYLITNPIHRRKSHLLPELHSSFRDTLESYLLETQKISMKILGMLAKTLKMMELKEMEDLFDDGMRSVRITYYPPCPQPELVMGITPHSDATAITILHQVNGVDGLQIKKDGVWLPVSILPDALVVNVGDILEIMSNGVCRSIEHRAAINSEKERISIAYFVQPNLDADIGPATNLISPENPPLFRRIQTEEYVKSIFSRKLNGKSFLEHMRLGN